MNAPVKVCRMTPADDMSGVNVFVDPVYLDDIPKAMDNMGWTVSAQLMRRWFAQPVWAMPQTWRRRPPVPYTDLPPSQLDDQIVKINWTLQFPQVQAALIELRKQWASRRGVDLLMDQLGNAGWQPGRTCNLGDKRMKAKQLDTVCQVNFQPLGSAWDTLNDYYGAIFMASLKVAVVGKAYRSARTGRDMFQVESLGFYLRDTYDFNAGWIEDAFMGLGVWSKQRVLSKAEMMDFKALSHASPASLLMRHIKYPKFVQLRNADFRRWQQTCKGGGDFFVFSDVLWEPYRGPDIELA